jgi:hypothetical protein
MHCMLWNDHITLILRTQYLLSVCGCIFMQEKRRDKLLLGTRCLLQPELTAVLVMWVDKFEYKYLELMGRVLCKEKNHCGTESRPRCTPKQKRMFVWRSCQEYKSRHKLIAEKVSSVCVYWLNMSEWRVAKNKLSRRSIQVDQCVNEPMIAENTWEFNLA